MAIERSDRHRPAALRIARALGAISLLVLGGVHFEQYTVAHFSAIPTIGPLFLVNFIAATVLGLVLLIPVSDTIGSHRLVIESLAGLAGVGVAVGALAALLISEQTPLFGFMEQGYRLEIVIAIAAEAAAIVSLGAFLACAHGRARDSRRGTPPTGHDDPSARRPRRGRDPAMPQLYMVTVPGLDVRSDWAPIHDRLLDDFPRITDVLATTITATILIVYEGRPEIDAWLDGVVDAIRWRRMRLDGRRHA